MEKESLIRVSLACRPDDGGLFYTAGIVFSDIAPEAAPNGLDVKLIPFKFTNPTRGNET